MNLRGIEHCRILAGTVVGIATRLEHYKKRFGYLWGMSMVGESLPFPTARTDGRNATLTGRSADTTCDPARSNRRGLAFNPIARPGLLRIAMLHWCGGIPWKKSTSGAPLPC